MSKGLKGVFIFLLVLAGISISMFFVLKDSKNEFKVIFDSNGGNEITNQVVKKGEKVIKPDDPVNGNKVFIEWQLDGAKYNFDNTVTKDMTLKALWRELSQYVVKVNLEGSEYTTTATEGFILDVESLNMPTKDGYTITLYNGEEEYDLALGITSNLNLTAKYVERIIYTVKFDSDGGTKVDDVKADRGTTVANPNIEREGYTLVGWYNGEERFDFATPIMENITLKAKWTKNN